MRWGEALKRLDGATLTNRAASGILLFARAAARKHAARVRPFPWLDLALPALGARALGDQLDVSTTNQLQPYPAADRLRAALGELARELDAGDVPFALVTDPRGTSATFHRLAVDTAMASAASLSGAGANAPAIARPTVRSGSRSEHVAAVQRALGVDVDGVFGKQTEAAVIEFQRRAGLKPDGVVGPKTWAMLTTGASAPAREPSHGPLKIAMQPPSKARPGKAVKVPKSAPKPAPPPPGDEEARVPGEGPVTKPGGEPGPPPPPHIQPVDEPIPLPPPTKGGGGGVLLLLALVALGTKRKRRR